MKNKIKSLDDLRTERRRLKAELAESEALLRRDVADFQEAIKPINAASRFVGKWFSTKDKNFVNEGIDTVLTFALRRVLLARAGWITRMVVPYLVKNYTNNKLNENKTEIIGTVRHWLHNFQEKRKQKTNGYYDRSTADTNIDV